LAFSFESTTQKLLPILSTLVSDSEFVVRQHLAEQFAELGRFFVHSGGETGYRLLISTLLPLLSQLVSDSQAAVRHAAGDGLVAVAELLRVEDQGQHILTTVLQLSHDDEQEDLRMAAVVLLNQLAKYLGPELCHQFVTPEIVSLSEDPVFRVRKATALNIHNVCVTAGPQDTTERLLPAFLRLTQDDIWGVRKACAENLCAISQAIDEPLRVEQLVGVLERFLTDSSKWVRSAVYQQLGPFLSSLPREQITAGLLEHYTSMAEVQDDAEAADESKLFCAFSIPAVAVTLGKPRCGWLRLPLHAACAPPLPGMPATHHSTRSLLPALQIAGPRLRRRGGHWQETRNGGCGAPLLFRFTRLRVCWGPRMRSRS
jgi:serine/threonine-protein phosphatase 4 regulatory subunit 1